jgi:DNA repair exonuclease SbcCD ATPase subunit
MNDTKQNNTEKGSEKKEQDSKEAKKEKTMNGTEQEKEKLAWWETAANTIAGNNQMMGNILKFVLSPLGLIIGAAIVGFGIYKMKTLKTELEKLKADLQKLGESYKELEEEHEKLRKKHKKLKALNEFEAEKTTQGLGFLNQPMFKQEPEKKQMYQTAYL